MSNQEAIEALKRIRDEAIENFIGEWSDYEAFGIAIKALKGADRKRGRVDDIYRKRTRSVPSRNQPVASVKEVGTALAV